MATKVETFDTKEERNARWEELRRTEKGVVRFSGVRDTGAREAFEAQISRDFEEGTEAGHSVRHYIFRGILRGMTG